VHGSNTRNLSVALTLSQTSKNAVFIIAYVFSSTKLEKKAEHVLPGSEKVQMERKGTGDGGEMA
jgi:hypothetical protein